MFKKNKGYSKENIAKSIYRHIINRIMDNKSGIYNLDDNVVYFTRKIDVLNGTIDISSSYELDNFDRYDSFYMLANFNELITKGYDEVSKFIDNVYKMEYGGCNLNHVETKQHKF